MGQLNTIQRAWFKQEANYGGGDGGIEYAKTEPIAVDSLTPFNYVVSGDFKGKNIKKERYTAPGIAIGSELVAVSDIEWPEVSITYPLQTGTIAATLEFLKEGGVQGTKGTVGEQTYIIQVQTPDPTAATGNVLYNLYGCQLTEWSVTGSYDSEDVPLVTCKFTAYDVVLNTDAAGTIQTDDYPTGVVYEWEDTSCTLDGDTFAELNSYTITIVNKFSKPKVNANHSQVKIKPYLIDKTSTAKIEFFLDAADRLADIYLDATYLYDLVWSDGISTLTITNMFTDDSDILSIDAKSVGMVKYSIDCKSGNSAYTCPAA